jgi:hypothetical protein
MSKLHIQGPTAAEHDPDLIECFHDTGILKSLIDGSFSILAGRKGAGKTAVAKYLSQKYEQHDLFGALRIPITSFSEENAKQGSQDTKDKILLFVLLKTAKFLYDEGYLLASSTKYWQSVFKEVGMDSSFNFDSFETVSRKSSIGASVTGFFKAKTEESREKNVPEIAANAIFSNLIESLEVLGADTKYLIFVDDVSDYLDNSADKNLKGDIHVICEVLLKLDFLNANLSENKRGLRFIACVRDDLFEFMLGSNVNKLKSNAKFLTWNEADMASMLIRRLPYFENERDDALSDPVRAISALFPDEIFQDELKSFDTKKFHTNFYAFVVAISFNRPRDFLAFCHALKERLSTEHEATIENIDAAEVEYTDYFVDEIRDELYLASRIFEFKADAESINRLIDLLARHNGFSSTQLRTDIAGLLEVKTSLGRKRIESFVHELWWYGILGFKENKEELISFRYMTGMSRFLTEKADKYTYYLHRGLWWYAQKRRGTRSTRGDSSL